MIISEGRRLAYYRTKADSKFWDSHWSGLAEKAEWEKAEKGFLGWFEKPFTKYLPKSGKIIEAGCGLGYYVLALGRRGYEIEGVEWSRKAVGLIKQRYPKLKVGVGDVRNLAVKDSYYSGYISLGVVEHDKSGPQDYLREAARVLKTGGAALISVPHFNLLRRIKSLLGLYAGRPEKQKFYQYAFGEKELRELVEAAGFRVIDFYRYDGYKSVKEELPFLRNLVISAAKNRHYQSNVDLSDKKQRRPWWLKLIDKYFGHMTMVVCVKE